MTEPIIAVVAVSKRKFNLVEVTCSGQSNLQIYTNNKLGEHNQMFSSPRATLLLEKPVDYREAMRVQAFLSQGIELSEITDNIKEN